MSIWASYPNIGWDAVRDLVDQLTRWLGKTKVYPA